MGDGKALNEFLERFALPLVRGGPVHIDGLLGPGVLRSFVEDRAVDGTLMQQLAQEARSLLQHLGPLGLLEPVPRDAIVLAATWNNILALTHPEASASKSLRSKVSHWCEQALHWVGPPRTSREVVMRHALLSRLEDLGRVDTDVTFWAGSAKYLGVAPPKRLTAWPGVRRVHEAKQRFGFYTLLETLQTDREGENLLAVARWALALSPLTDLGTADRPESCVFVWTPMSLNALADAPLRGAAERLVLARARTTATRVPEMSRASNMGPKQAEQAVAPAIIRALEHATGLLLSQSLPARAVLTSVLFHLELLVSDVLSRGSNSPPQPLAWALFGQLGPERVARLLGLQLEDLEPVLRLEQRLAGAAKHTHAAELVARAGLEEVSS